MPVGNRVIPLQSTRFLQLYAVSIPPLFSSFITLLFSFILSFFLFFPFFCHSSSVLDFSPDCIIAVESPARDEQASEKVRERTDGRGEQQPLRGRVTHARSARSFSAFSQPVHLPMYFRRRFAFVFFHRAAKKTWHAERFSVFNSTRRKNFPVRRGLASRRHVTWNQSSYCDVR